MRFTLSVGADEIFPTDLDTIVDVLNLWIRDDDFDGGVDTIALSVRFADTAGPGVPEASNPDVRVTADKARRRARVRFVSYVPRPKLAEPPRWEDRPRVFFAPFAEEICAAVASMIRKRPKPGAFDAAALVQKLRLGVSRLAVDGAALAATLEEARSFASGRETMAEEAKRQARGEIVMGYDAFWFTLAESRRLAGGDPSKTLVELRRRLVGLAPAGIVAFRNVLARRLWLLDSETTACRGRAGPFDGSDEEFLFERCTAVLGGKELCDAVHADPSKLPSRGVVAEQILYVPDEAYAEVTGAHIPIAPLVSVESRSNPSGWRPEKLGRPEAVQTWRLREGGFTELAPATSFLAPCAEDVAAADVSFWKLVDAARESAAGGSATPSPRATVRALRTLLTKRSEEEIVAFRDMLARKLYELDTERIACRGRPPPFAGSGDSFLYDRCDVVARGRAFFESVVADPSQLPDDAGLEELLYVAEEAFEIKTGEALTDGPPVMFETGSNHAGWTRH